MVSEITTGDHSEGADGRQSARFGAAQSVFMMAVADDFALLPARQVQVSCKRLAWIERAIMGIAFSIEPTRIVTRI